MAQTVKAYSVLSKQSIGGVMQTVTEVELGTEYKKEGVVISPESCGLTDGIVTNAWASGPAFNAKGTKSVPALITFTSSTISCQLYQGTKEKEFAAEEVEDKKETYKEYKLLLVVTGK